MEAKKFCKALFPDTFFGLVARKPQHIRKKKPLENKTEDGFCSFPLHWCVQGEKGRFCSLSDNWVGGESLESTHFLTHILRKRKISLLNAQTRGAGTKPHFQEGKHGKIQERHMHAKEAV